MLADYTVDTENFKEIMEEAKKMAAGFPLWTDFNYHDPGITLIELFSWLKEGQQYFMDQIGPEHKQKYLEFLGIFMEHRKAAKTYVSISSDKSFIMPSGTKFYAGEVCFETLSRQGIFNNKITECFQGNKTMAFQCRKEHLNGRENLRIPVFGENPKAGEQFYIGLQKPVPAGRGIGFYIKMLRSADMKRNPLSGTMHYPMLKIKYEYFTGGEWKEVEKVSDSTWGMLEDGILYFEIKENMEEAGVWGRTAYYFRMEAVFCEIDMAPVIENIKLNVFPVVQKNTCIFSEEIKFKNSGKKCRGISRSFPGIEGENRLYMKCGELYYPVLSHEKYVFPDKGEAEFIFEPPCEEGEAVLIVSYCRDSKVKRCIGIGNGFPYQEYKIGTGDAAAEDIEILVHEIGTPDGFRRWEKVIDFGNSGPMDYHYVADTKEGKIIFGDCERGMAPEGEIILISASETLGEEGNVKAGKITRINDSKISKRIKINNFEDAAGGKNEESIEEAFLGAREMLKGPFTAVTYKDYENYVKNTPGLMIESCKAIPSKKTGKHRGMENSLSIIVKPRSQKRNPRLSENYRKNISAHLEKYRMLGTHIEVLSPRYILMELSLDLTVRPHYANAGETIRRAVEEYLNKLSGEFGAVIVYNQLYGIIDMLDCVETVNTIDIGIREPKAVRTKEGNIVLPQDGIIETAPENIKYRISLSGE